MQLKVVFFRTATYFVFIKMYFVLFCGLGFDIGEQLKASELHAQFTFLFTYCMSQYVNIALLLNWFMQISCECTV